MVIKKFYSLFILSLSLQTFAADNGQADNYDHINQPDHSVSNQNDDHANSTTTNFVHNSENLTADSLLFTVPGKANKKLEFNEQIEINVNLDFVSVGDQKFDKDDLLKKLWVEYHQFKAHGRYKKNKKDEIIYLFANVKNEVKIPMSIRDPEVLKSLEHLSAAELTRFFEKKQGFLSRFAEILAQVQVNPLTINLALMELNEQFYQSRALLGKSNSLGGTVMFSLSGGLALPQKIVQSLKNKFQFANKYLPESGGFYYLLGLGAGIVKTHDFETGKDKLSFELFVDSEKLIKTMTGMVELSMAGTYGIVYELREGHFFKQTNTTMYGGATGVFRRGEYQFGWAASTGLSMPPGIGAFLIYQDQTTRRYLLRGSVDAKYVLPLIQFIGAGYRLTKTILSPILQPTFQYLLKPAAKTLGRYILMPSFKGFHRFAINPSLSLYRKLRPFRCDGVFMQYGVVEL